MACLRLIVNPYCRLLFRSNKALISQACSVNIIKEYISNKITTCEYSSRSNLPKTRENLFQPEKELETISSNSDFKLLQKYNLKWSEPYHEGDSLDNLKEMMAHSSESLRSSIAGARFLIKKFKSTRVQWRKAFVNEIINIKEFKDLYTNLENYLPTASASELISILQMIKCFELDVNHSLTTKTLLVAIRGVNRFSTSEAIKMFLMTSEKFLAENEISLSLRTASLNFVISRIKNGKLDPANEKTAAYFASQAGIPNIIRVGYLKMISDGKIKELHPNSYSTVLKALYVVRMGSNEIYNLFLKIVDLVNKNINVNWSVLDVREISTWASKLFLKYHFEMTDNFHNFFEKITRYALENEINVFHAMKFMNDLCNLNHLNTSLLEYTLKKSAESELKPETEFLLFTNLLRILSYTGFPEACPDHLKDQIKKKIRSLDFSNMELEDKKKNHFTGLLDTGLGLAAIDLFNFDAIRKIFEILNQGYRERTFEPLIMNCDWTSLLLYKWATEMDPNCKNLLSKDVLDSCIMTVLHKQKFTWKTNLETILGGKEFLLTNCTLFSHFSLSYIFLLDSENKPQDLSLYKTASVEFPVNAEIIRAPENCKLVVLQELFSGVNLNFLNVPIEIARIKLFREVLESLGYYVIILDSYDKITLAEFEKPLYLQSVLQRNFGKINK